MIYSLFNHDLFCPDETKHDLRFWLHEVVEFCLSDLLEKLGYRDKWITYLQEERKIKNTISHLVTAMIHGEGCKEKKRVTWYSTFNHNITLSKKDLYDYYKNLGNLLGYELIFSNNIILGVRQ